MSLDVYLESGREELYWSNTSSHFKNMAKEAGLYKTLWEPEENAKSDDLVFPLYEGLNRLKRDPNHFKKFNVLYAKYEEFLRFVQRYFDACCDNPGANVRIS